MKTKLFFAMLMATAMAIAQGQTERLGDQCIYLGSGSNKSATVTATTSTGTKNMVLLFCVEQGQSDAIPVSVINSIRNNIPNYFSKATFNNWNVNILDVLVSSSDATTVHAFVLPGLIGSDDMVPASLAENVLSQADAIYDFANYDVDGDGIVDYLAFLVYRHSAGVNRGTVGLPVNRMWPTNDGVSIDGSNLWYGNDHSFTQRVNNSQERTESMMFHELGHSWFGWPDVDHGGFSDYNHYAFGDFDAMSSGWGGFHNVSSLYNPGFRVAKGWATPTDAAGTKTFSDFDATGQIYAYTLPSYANAIANQQYYFTYYTKDQTNHWQANWDVPKLSDGVHYAGVLVWRRVGNVLGSYSKRKAMPLTIEAAHGKWVWSENWPYPAPLDAHPVNTGQADILNGFDSLQVRYSYIWGVFAGIGSSGNPTYNWQLYRGNLYQIGSASCFFAPEHNRDFAFYTNPSSNEIAFADSSRSIAPGFAMKNLRWEGGQARADFVTGEAAYTITENATLTAGTWYINNTITVSSGVTLTINPGAVLKFPSANIRITVNGTLNVAGTASNPATIDFTAPYVYGMNGIQFSSGASGSFSYCNIKNASYGVYAGNAYVSMDHCNITNCQQSGVYASGRFPTITNSTFTGNGTAINIGSTGFVADRWITGNTISSNRYGIYLNNSSPRYFESNTVSNNTEGGIWCSNGSTPYMRGNTISGNGGDGLHAEGNSPVHFGSYYGDPGLNVVRQNSRYGIYANSSNVYLGSTDTHYGMNSIYNNGSYELLATYNSNVMAQYNWWNYPYMPYYPPWDLRSENGGSFTAYPGLTWDPNSGRTASMTTLASVSAAQETGTPGMPGKQPEVVAGDTSFFDSELSAAMSKLSEGKHNEAIPLFARKFRKERNERKRIFALEELAECYRVADTSATGRVTSAKRFLDFLNEEVQPILDKAGTLYARTLQLKSIALLDAGQTEKAVDVLVELKGGYKEENIQRTSLFNMAYIHQNLLGNKQKGREYFAQLKEMYPGDDLVRIGELVLVDFGDTPNADSGPSAEKGSALKTDSAVTGLANYPNPFNPTTAISYRLPNSGRVELKVYDVLGREVITLVREYQDAGVHTAYFNGQNLASGVYFYRLTAPGISQVKKMLMVK